MTEMFGEAWPPMSVPDLAPDDDDDDDDDVALRNVFVLFYISPSQNYFVLGHMRYRRR